MFQFLAAAVVEQDATRSRCSRRTPTARSSTGQGRRITRTRRRRRSRSRARSAAAAACSTISLIALIVGVVALLLGGIALARETRRRRAAARVSSRIRSRVSRSRRAARCGALARARRCRPRARRRTPTWSGPTPVASGVLDSPPSDGRADLRRGGRAAVRDRVGDRRVRRRSKTTGRRPALARPNPDTLTVPLTPRLPEGWYLVYWRAISVDGHPVQGAFTFAGRPEPGPGAAVPGPARLGDRRDAAAAGRAGWVAFVVGDERDRAVRAARSLIARPRSAPRTGHEPALRSRSRSRRPR